MAIAHAQRKTLGPQPRAGSRIDEDASFYCWIRQDGEGVRISTIPVSPIRNQVVNAFTEKAVREARNEKPFADARRAALAYLEANLADAERKTRLASLLKQEAKRQQDIEAVDRRLAAELERQRRAQTALTIMSAIGRGLTLTEQILTFTTALGNDAPASVKEAKTGQDLQAMAGKLLSEAQAAEGRLRIQHVKYLDELKGTKIEILNVMQESSYPFGGVPQLGRPEINIR